MRFVEIYTDGSCVKDKNGGWGVVLRERATDHYKELSGWESNTTSSRMEMLAVVKGLEILKEPCNVVVYSDSTYVVNTFDKGWALSWRSKGWRKSNGDTAFHVDLIEKILGYCEVHNVSFRWIKGHATNKGNVIADSLANKAAKNRKGVEVSFDW